MNRLRRGGPYRPGANSSMPNGAVANTNNFRDHGSCLGGMQPED